MAAHVAVGGEETHPFGVAMAVKQGCVMAPVIFNIYLAAASCLFRQRFSAGRGVGLSYRLDGSLFNLRRLQARTKVSETIKTELQYADDCALVAHSPTDLQAALTTLQEVYSALGLVVNTHKTEIVFQWSSDQHRNIPLVTVAGRELKVQDQFSYLAAHCQLGAHSMRR